MAYERLLHTTAAIYLYDGMLFSDVYNPSRENFIVRHVHKCMQNKVRQNFQKELLIDLSSNQFVGLRTLGPGDGVSRYLFQTVKALSQFEIVFPLELRQHIDLTFVSINR